MNNYLETLGKYYPKALKECHFNFNLDSGDIIIGVEVVYEDKCYYFDKEHKLIEFLDKLEEELK